MLYIEKKKMQMSMKKTPKVVLPCGIGNLRSNQGQPHVSDRQALRSPK